MVIPFREHHFRIIKIYMDTNLEYPIAKVIGAMKYDSWTLGNHEFNYGLDVLNRVIGDYKKEGIAVLGANIYKQY